MNRRGIIPAVLVVLLIGGCFWLLTSVKRSVPSLGPPGSMYNTDDDGAAALQRWLAAIGYKAESFEYRQWQFDDKADALLIFTPSDPITQQEVDVALDWVSTTGGTLIVVDSFSNPFFEHYNLRLASDAEPLTNTTVLLQQPLANPSVKDMTVRSSLSFETNRSNGVVLAEVQGQPVLVAISEGSGMIYLCSAPDLFSNTGLINENNARVMLNMLSHVPQNGRVLFDEVHHERNIPPAPPGKPVAFPPLVAALIYLAVILGMWALLTGRRFGALVPLRSEMAQRSSAEYIQSMAILFRRGRQSSYILQHYKQMFKRRLATPYAINPNSADADFIRELQRFVTLDAARLAALLQALSIERPSEDHLLRSVHATDTFIHELESRR